MSSLYQEWLQQWDRKLRAENRKILLFQDNFSGHIVPDGLQNICVENFEPNLTAHVQPMDRESFDASKLIIMQSLFRVPLIATTEV